MFAAIENKLSVDESIFDTDCILMRVFERRLIRDSWD